MRPLFIALGAAAFFLLAMAFPSTIVAVLDERDPEDYSLRNDVIARSYVRSDGPVDLVVVWCNSRVEGVQAKWLLDHEGQLRAEVAERLLQAGIRSMAMTCNDLNPKIRMRLENGPTRPDIRRSGDSGVVRIDFSNIDVASDGARGLAIPPRSTIEYTAHARVTILMGNIGLRFGSQRCDQTCAVANVICHGIGHALGFEDPGHSIPYFPFSFSECLRTWLMHQPPDVMMQSQPFDSVPLPFNASNDRNRAAIAGLRKNSYAQRKVPSWEASEPGVPRRYQR
jgi:hypothetical protein